MTWDVVKVSPTGPLTLEVHFADGLRGRALFSESALVGVFEALKNPIFFSQVKLRNGYVTWPGELDLAPDAMYSEIKKTGEWRFA
jgi:hypothetical protein